MFLKVEVDELKCKVDVVVVVVVCVIKVVKVLGIKIVWGFILVEKLDFNYKVIGCVLFKFV